MKGVKAKASWISGAVLLPVLLAVTGCSGKEGAGMPNDSAPAGSQTVVGGKQEATEPVTLRLLAGDSYMPDADYQMLLVEPLKRKYPHITLELIRPVKGTMIEDLIAAKAVPDLFILGQASKRDYQSLDLLTDLQPLMKQHKWDLTRFQSGLLDIFGENGQIYGVPYANNLNVTYYNKDLFNKFAVAYPQDGMLWEDALALARKLTRTVDGVQYRGFDYNSTLRPSMALSLNLVDEKGNVSLQTDLWKRMFATIKAFDDIPGNRRVNSYLSEFMDERITAMLGSINLLSRLNVEKYAGLDWDMVQYPSYPERPNTFTHPDLHIIAASKTSKHLEQALQVMEVMTSDEVQLISSRKTGRVSPLKDKSFQDQFAADMPLIQGKRFAAIFKSQYAPIPTRYGSRDDEKVKGVLNTNYPLYRDGVIDINTFLRQAEEEATKLIQASK